ncbi:hypothetical protein JHW43_003981 [Diplocarpon mali]|nr:hypothetical protein JHW43_003981 [Diplocarpon mali]
MLPLLSTRIWLSRPGKVEASIMARRKHGHPHLRHDLDRPECRLLSLSLTHGRGVSVLRRAPLTTATPLEVEEQSRHPDLQFCQTDLGAMLRQSELLAKAVSRQASVYRPSGAQAFLFPASFPGAHPPKWLDSCTGPFPIPTRWLFPSASFVVILDGQFPCPGEQLAISGLGPVHLADHMPSHPYGIMDACQVLRPRDSQVEAQNSSQPRRPFNHPFLCFLLKRELVKYYDLGKTMSCLRLSNFPLSRFQMCSCATRILVSNYQYCATSLERCTSPTSGYEGYRQTDSTLMSLEMSPGWSLVKMVNGLRNSFRRAGKTHAVTQ